MRQGDLLLEAAKINILGHAYILAGNDERAKESVIQSMLQTLSISPADFMLIAPTKESDFREITIADIRRLGSFLSMTAWSSPYKIAHIVQAHLMNQEAQSALLKVLEEPSGQTVIFLQTQRADFLLNTIRSRAGEIKFFSFSSGDADPEIIKKIQKLQHADLGTRFALAKELGETPEKITKLLEEWLQVFRYFLHKTVSENQTEALSMAKNIRILQETQSLLGQRSVDPRLALERILINF